MHASPENHDEAKARTAPAVNATVHGSTNGIGATAAAWGAAVQGAGDSIVYSMAGALHTIADGAERHVFDRLFGGKSSHSPSLSALDTNNTGGAQVATASDDEDDSLFESLFDSVGDAIYDAKEAIGDTVHEIGEVPQRLASYKLLAQP